MLEYIMADLHDRLLSIGYLIGKQVSYQTAASASLPEPLMHGERNPLQALHIIHLKEKFPTTIIEIIFPFTKRDDHTIGEYRRDCHEYLKRLNANLIEIDLTRSDRHIHDLSDNSHYPVVTYLPVQSPLAYSNVYGQPLKEIVISLETSVVTADLQPVYDRAYQAATIAGHIRREGRYQEAYLPFPTLLTDEQRADALSKVAAWEQQLSALEGHRDRH
jgi:hypothetical protein